MRIALVSLEPWDDVWRRNQHISSELVDQGVVDSLVFIEPPRLGRTLVQQPFSPKPGITVLAPRLSMPKRVGGLRLLGVQLRRTWLRGLDLLWVNDPALGVQCQSSRQPAVYDVTDDWRDFDFPRRIRRRIISAEDRLARTATTVVCSDVLRQRWLDRYGVEAHLVNNGVDTRRWRQATRRKYDGRGPHIGYVGTLHTERIDLDLIQSVADMNDVGTFHLVGPDSLDADARKRLHLHPKIEVHGPVPSADVAAWTKGFDVLVSPHRITPFTLSLDAIKSYEYAASGRPVVATPTSGFQLLKKLDGITVVNSEGFAEAVRIALQTTTTDRNLPAMDWSDRAREFERVLKAAAAGDNR